MIIDNTGICNLWMTFGRSVFFSSPQFSFSSSTCSVFSFLGQFGLFEIVDDVVAVGVEGALSGLPICRANLAVLVGELKGPHQRLDHVASLREIVDRDLSDDSLVVDDMGGGWNILVYWNLEQQTLNLTLSGLFLILKLLLSFLDGMRNDGGGDGEGFQKLN